jgi:threonine-phosphate decarboxylase
MSREENKKHGGNVYAAIRNQGGTIGDFLDFSANINPLGLSPFVRAALLDSLDAVTAYPDPDAVALKEAISNCYGVPAECIETGNGAVEIIYLLGRVLAPSRVLLPSPTFSEYEAAARATGLSVTQIMLRESTGFAPALPELTEMIDTGDLLFLCNPNNPTGVVFSRRQLLPLVEKATAIGAHIVVDESFIDFRAESALESCRTLVGEYPGVVVLHSLTKFLAVPGLRLGFMLGAPELAEQMKKLRDPWNVNVLAQAAGVAGLADQEYRRRTVALINQEKESLRNALETIPGIRVFPPAVNFILADIGDAGWDAGRLQAALLPYRILIRSCANFDALSDRFIRMAVKNPQDNQRLISVLKKIMLGVDLQ